MSGLTLSVLVISHNQRAQIKRCLGSILSQQLPFEYEIVISDDASRDGTWELEMEYAEKFPFIKALSCNSDDCHPTITSERSGYNRSNAYSHSCGKYFVHIDADDWYRPGSHCLEEQVRLLEEHPECSMCMQDEWCWDEGSPLDSGHSTRPLHRFTTGEIITAEYYYRENILVNNALMMMRRDYRVNPVEQYHKWYVDTIITAHHLQFGPIVCLDTNDWIYTQSPLTITNCVNHNDRTLLWGLNMTVFLSILIPTHWTLYFSSSYSLSLLLDAVRLLLANEVISSQIALFCSQFSDKAFLYKVAVSPQKSWPHKIRLLMIREMTKSMLKNNNSMKISILHHLCI